MSGSGSKAVVLFPGMFSLGRASVFTADGSPVLHLGGDKPKAPESMPAAISAFVKDDANPTTELVTLVTARGPGVFKNFGTQPRTEDVVLRPNTSLQEWTSRLQSGQVCSLLFDELNHLCLKGGESHGDAIVQIRVDRHGSKEAYFFTDGEWRPLNLNRWRDYFKVSDNDPFSISDGSLSLSFLANEAVLMAPDGLSPQKRLQLYSAIQDLKELHSLFSEYGYQTAFTELFRLHLDPNSNRIGHISETNISSTVFLLNQILGYKKIALRVESDGHIEAVEVSNRDKDVDRRFAMKFESSYPGIFEVYLRNGDGHWQKYDPSENKLSASDPLSKTLRLPNSTGEEFANLSPHLAESEELVRHIAWTELEYRYFLDMAGKWGDDLDLSQYEKLLKFAARCGFLFHPAYLPAMNRDSSRKAKFLVRLSELHYKVLEDNKAAIEFLVDGLVRQNSDDSTEFRLSVTTRLQFLIKQVLNEELLACVRSQDLTEKSDAAHLWDVIKSNLALNQDHWRAFFSPQVSARLALFLESQIDEEAIIFIRRSDAFSERLVQEFQNQTDFVPEA